MVTRIVGKVQKVTSANDMFLRIYADTSFLAAAAFPKPGVGYTGASLRYVCTITQYGVSDTQQEGRYEICISDDTGAVNFRCQGNANNTMDLSFDPKTLHIYGYKTAGDSLDVEHVDTELWSTFG